MHSAALGELLTARALWILKQNAATPAISAATNALVEGYDSESLRELAAASPVINVFQLGTLIVDALSSLGIAAGTMTREDAQLAATHYYASQVLAGNLRIRELTRWVHRTIGHEGHPVAQELVNLDDAYDAYDDGWGEEPNAMQVITRFVDAACPELKRWTRTGTANQ
ncbi:hypothetical protein [Paenarthrobacter histidinolovorans]|uniref:hypothetical protein n=1 Tax=Paenarthrobacter histidinolovorans TaxID=43664 RepID=UPI00166765EA|nr:hypothetical protein [Paenarthrobacter histidinolovorans]GGJ18078.1 hypothetical protein GCM10010052_14210 [Paenarthrobacter histidinolovorans]